MQVTPLPHFTNPGYCPKRPYTHMHAGHSVLPSVSQGELPQTTTTTTTTTTNIGPAKLVDRELGYIVGRADGRSVGRSVGRTAGRSDGRSVWRHL